MGKPTCKRKITKTNTFYVYFHGCAVVQAKDEEEARNIVIDMSNEEIGKYVDEIDDVQKEKELITIK